MSDWIRQGPDHPQISLSFSDLGLAAQPASSSDADYLAFFQAYDGVLESLTAATPQQLVQLGAWEMAKPAAGGDTAYGTWLQALGQRITSVSDADSDADASELQLEIASLLKVKPCSGPQSAAKFAPIAGRLAKVPALASLAQSAAPVVCAQ